jgi:2-oxoglutarate ferredoxin oxidoreductase subunit alpha
MAKYSEAGKDYIYNVHRLLKKFATARSLVPQPVLRKAEQQTECGIIYYGSTAPALDETIALLRAQGLHFDTMRLRAFPFPESVGDFIAQHRTVFLVEQNRDAQMKALIVNELAIAPDRLVSVLHYDGTPITARFITERITTHLQAAKAAAQ